MSSAIPEVVIVIPARYGSTRLPGKPLVSLAGKPMIQHVYERAGWPVEPTGSSSQQTMNAS